MLTKRERLVGYLWLKGRSDEGVYRLNSARTRENTLDLSPVTEFDPYCRLHHVSADRVRLADQQVLATWPDVPSAISQLSSCPCSLYPRLDVSK